MQACQHSPEPIQACKPPVVVSFSKNIIPIFNTYCSLTGCHSGNTPTGNLNLEADSAYKQLSRSGSGYIDTVNPRFSLLYAQLNSVSTPMPPTGKLNGCTIQLVLAWIEQKAKNN